LFELAGSKDEVPWRDFISECLADLGDAKGKLLSAGHEDVFVVDEDSLCCFGPQVGYRGCIRHGTDIRLEHEVEITWHGQRRLAAARRGHLSCNLLAW